MFCQLKYIFIICITSLLLPLNQELLAEDLTQGDSKQLLNEIELWLVVIQQNSEQLSPQELALIESNLASNYLNMGNYAAAIQHWESAIKIYRTHQQPQLLAANLSDLAQAYLGLGQTLLAENKINEAILIAEQEKLSNILHSSYLTLGNIQKVQGKYLEAENNLNSSLKYAAEPEEKVTAHNNLSQVFYAKSQKLEKQAQDIAAEELDSKELPNQAIDYLERSWANALSASELSKELESLVTVGALLQMLKLGQVNKDQDFKANAYLNRAEIILSALPHSTRKVYALINLSEFQQNPVATLRQATQIAEDLKDNRSSSFAYGLLGTYYERSKQYDAALAWTNKAILAASQAQTNRSLYQWYWQKGRIYTSLGQTEPAILAYNQAISSLQKISSELARIPHEQLDFSREIEPVYRELLQLLLSEPNPEQIQQALAVRDLLQLSELENFFGDDCLTLRSEPNRLLPDQIGLIYTIILPETTHVIFQQGEEIKRITIDITQPQLEELVRQWRYSLEDQTEENYLALSKRMYDLLIKPLQSELSKKRLETLIFVNDGILKNVPMAALHDGQKFLVEDYALGVSLSLNLQIKTNESFTAKTRVLAFGLSEQIANLPALPYVKQEIQSIGQIVEVKQVLDSDFTSSRVEKELMNRTSPLVHFATHSKFGGLPENSFLSTYQEQLSLLDLANILNQHQTKWVDNQIKLLVLSACSTAAGNKRATLGLTGVAIRSGVPNVIGSLWSVNDRAEVALIEQFYRSLLQEGMSPSQALRQAQIKMIGDRTFHPAIWSNLISILN